ncbi:MAG TPA: hypothetical protein PKC13_28235, partial [Blastocatellia bacterium]|nr:hypothetical protein [Blastocatellia bacterium]
PARMSAAALEAGYWRAYKEFYRWSSILQGAMSKAHWLGRLRHLSYAGGWKKFEPLWDWIIRAKRAGAALPALEAILSGFGKHIAVKENDSKPKSEIFGEVHLIEARREKNLSAG